MKRKITSPKSPYSAVPIAALKYEPSDRIKQLAEPKTKEDAHVRTGLLIYT